MKVEDGESRLLLSSVLLALLMEGSDVRRLTIKVVKRLLTTYVNPGC